MSTFLYLKVKESEITECDLRTICKELRAKSWPGSISHLFQNLKMILREKKDGFFFFEPMLSHGFLISWGRDPEKLEEVFIVMDRVAEAVRPMAPGATVEIHEYDAKNRLTIRTEVDGRTNRESQ